MLNVTEIYIAIAIIVIAIIVILITYKSKNKKIEPPSRLAWAGMMLVILGIIVGAADARYIAYGCFGLGIMLSIIDIIKKYRKPPHQ